LFLCFSDSVHLLFVPPPQFVNHGRSAVTNGDPGRSGWPTR
jgi:hypothetical protein